jgi:hypothetical protein
MQWTDLVRHLNLSAVFTLRVFKSELIGLRDEVTVEWKIYIYNHQGQFIPPCFSQTVHCREKLVKTKGDPHGENPGEINNIPATYMGLSLG